MDQLTFKNQKELVLNGAFLKYIILQWTCKYTNIPVLSYKIIVQFLDCNFHCNRNTSTYHAKHEVSVLQPINFCSSIIHYLNLLP